MTQVYPNQATAPRGDEAQRPTGIDSEEGRAVLGAMLQGRAHIDAALAAGFEIKHLHPKYMALGETVLRMRAAGKPVDILTVAAELRLIKATGSGNDTEFDRIGRAPGLDSLIDACPIAAAAATYAAELRGQWLRERAEKLANDLRNALLVTAPEDLPDLYARHAADVAALGAPFASQDAEQRLPRVDFAELFAQDFTQVDWLPGRFLERGQQMALVGEGKAGKSLLALEWVWRAIRGERFLGDTRREPLRVQYWDRENSRADLFHRLRSLGATAADLDLLAERLDYRQFPAFTGALDESATAAAEFLAAMEDFKPDLVVIDTLSRFIAGKENDSDTFLAFYQRIHVPLKRAGIACVRLDHFGKDSDKGSRGSSAKNQDVDTVWELCVMGDPVKIHDLAAEVETVTTQLRMHRTHTRSGLGNDTFRIIRRAQQELTVSGVRGMWVTGRTSHAPMDAGDGNAHSNEVESCVDALIRAGLTERLGRDKMRAWAAENGVKLPGKAAVLADIAAALKARMAA